MTQKEILSAFNTPICPILKAYGGKLSGLFGLVKVLREIEGCKFEAAKIGNVELVRQLPDVSELKRDNTRRQGVERAAYLFGLFTEWYTITATHPAGKYIFQVPAGLKITDAVFSACGLIPETVQKVEAKILTRRQLPAALLPYFKKAVKFVSKDSLRPVFQNILVKYEGGKVWAVATDAHRLYLSPEFAALGAKDGEILVSPETACKWAKLKLSGEFTELQQVEGDFLQIEGELYPEFTGANFPDYKVVMPDYENYMTFDRAEMMQEIKKVLPSANRSTNQVSFHLNGSIELAAQDVDFSFESTGKLPYIKKTFPDTDIAFNGKLMNECLSVFKDKILKMYSEGSAKRCVLFKNQAETVLLMPLLLNC